MPDWKVLASHTRPLVGDVLHSDDCVIIRIKGAEWKVRPLQLPRGILYTPDFGDKVSLRQTVDPLGNKPMQDRAEELLAFLESGPEGLDGVLAVCTYLGELLDQQYEISAEDKADLLSFRGDTTPVWDEQAVRHANGLAPQVTLEESIAMMAPEVVTAPTPKTRFWQFWKK